MTPANRSKLELDASTGAPLYQQARDAIAAQITAGQLAAGDQLLSERRLCEEFGISRVTARRALIALEEDGLIGASPGRGWFVTDGPLSEPPNMLLSFTALARARGLAPTAKVLRRQVRPASMDEADVLGVAPGAELFELERIRLLDGLPVAVDHSVVPLQRCPALVDADFSSASLYEVLRTEGRVVPSRAGCTLEAMAAGPVMAPLLDLDEAAPVLVSRQTAYDQQDVAVETSRIVYRGDRYRFRTVLTADQPDPVGLRTGLATGLPDR
ncbi:GntR family transcriptional regulator [soil metagenome]